MTDTYKYLGTEQKEQMIKERITQFEAEHYSQTLNIKMLEEQKTLLPADAPEEDRKVIENQIVFSINTQTSLNAAIRVLNEETVS